ncbi:hypothetical protein RUM44_011502 [Polyplax serrata]|uniref:Uncharacterized protein n=1 Tax=Polyplax serrata TaxID=468196 RepID=A0ABR1AS15_POLSC
MDRQINGFSIEPLPKEGVAKKGAGVKLPDDEGELWEMKLAIDDEINDLLGVLTVAEKNVSRLEKFVTRMEQLAEDVEKKVKKLEGENPKDENEILKNKATLTNMKTMIADSRKNIDVYTENIKQINEKIKEKEDLEALIDQKLKELGSVGKDDKKNSTQTGGGGSNKDPSKNNETDDETFKLHTKWIELLQNNVATFTKLLFGINNQIMDTNEELLMNSDMLKSQTKALKEILRSDQEHSNKRCPFIKDIGFIKNKFNFNGRRHHFNG